MRVSWDERERFLPLPAYRCGTKFAGDSNRSNHGPTHSTFADLAQYSQHVSPPRVPPVRPGPCVSFSVSRLFRVFTTTGLCVGWPSRGSDLLSRTIRLAPRSSPASRTCRSHTLSQPLHPHTRDPWSDPVRLCLSHLHNDSKRRLARAQDNPRGISYQR
ncbi:hypothetical protein EXIGLDRAFT_462197 [Exidia glandulosa HHB12029]|uniref:Uncharacterized protein n=1 Tax=Exidia glandulosa HHB12029 TaxID=1314781 RepID=A0A165B023_EXIGL|nr:hypothetical protein EXIGLDRAFT_462197 [Exidia glandulosa HHB12029]